MTAIDRLAARAAEPVDAASVVAWRVAFGLAMLLAVVRFFAYGWIDQQYIQPDVYFPYPGFEWISPWPAWGMYAHFAALGVLAILVAAGVWWRASIGLFFLGFTYVELLDQTNYLNHYYLVSLLCGLAFFMPIGRGVRTIPRWCLWTLRVQVGLVYFFAGVAKLGADWLFEAQPLQIWLAANTDAPVVGQWLDATWIAYAASWAAAVFDLCLPFALLWRRTRVPAFAAAVVFHVATAHLFQLGLFPWLMLANATLLFEPCWPRRWLHRPAPTPVPAKRPLSRPALAVLAAYFAVQLVMPFRHLLYPGDVLWTEEGIRLSWKVMIAEKAGVARLHVTDDTGRTWLVYPRDYLAPRQVKMASTQPQMILQLAHYVADDFRRRGHTGVQVRAEVLVSLNGRRARPLVDPTVDLAAETTSLGMYDWIQR